MIDHNSDKYKQGFHDGQAGVDENIAFPPNWTYQQKLDYSAGMQNGRAYQSGDHDPLTAEERRQVYGEEHDQV